jgi:hypothetical protein
MRPSDTEQIAIVGMHATEARELAVAAEAVGLAVRLLAFGSPLADAALAAHGPGSVRLPLTIVAGRYSLQRPAFGTVLECIEVLRGTRQTLPAGCVLLASTADRDGHKQPANRAQRTRSRSTRKRSEAQHGRGRKTVGDTRHCARPPRQRRSWGRLDESGCEVGDPSARTSSAIYRGAPAELP